MPNPDPVFISVPGQSFTGNPYFPLLVEGLQHSGARVLSARSLAGWFGRKVILLVHFPDHCVTEHGVAGAMARTIQHLVLFLAVLAAGGRIVWFVHDVHPFRQKRRWLLEPYMALFARIIAARVFLSRTSRAQFHRDNPDCRPVPELLLPHGPYRTLCSADCGARLRGELGIARDNVLIGFLGAIKQYKNVGALEALPAQVAGRPLRVLMAGKCDPESAADALIAEVALTGRLRRIDSQPNDHELERMIRACDLVLMPYRTGYNSGMALLCLTCGTPVLTSRLPIFEELQEDFGSQWVRTFASPEDIADELEETVATMRTDRERGKLQALLEGRSFDRAAALLTAFAARL